MKKILLALLLCVNITYPLTVSAQPDNPEPPERFTRTILPETQVRGNANCRLVITRFENIYFFELDNEEDLNAAELGSISRFFQALNILKDFRDPIFGIPFQDLNQNDVLGCAILTGRIKMFYLSIFIAYALNMMAILAGSISMIFIMIGGYKYVLGSLTQNTDEAKKTIINAIIGLLVSTGAWIIVNIVQTIVSS
jgi:hypothetical protein